MIYRLQCNLVHMGEGWRTWKDYTTLDEAVREYKVLEKTPPDPANPHDHRIDILRDGG